MPSREEVAYFGAGPAPLPTHIIEAGARAFVNYNDTGLGLAEISHRSPTANAILAEAKSALTELLDIPENYEILFMQAGGSGEFSAVVQNLVPAWIERRRARIEQELIDEGKTEDVRQQAMVQRLRNAVEEELKVDYLVTGSWSLKASQEAARLLGERYVNVALDARKSNGGKFGKIPEDEPWALTKTKKEGGKAAPAFVYYCDNETVDGVEFQGFPKQLEPSSSEDDDDARLVVADMSSNFLSRKLDVKKYAVIFVGQFTHLHATANNHFPRAERRRTSASQASPSSSSANRSFHRTHQHPSPRFSIPCPSAACPLPSSSTTPPSRKTTPFTIPSPSSTSGSPAK